MIWSSGSSGQYLWTTHPVWKMWQFDSIKCFLSISNCVPFSSSEFFSSLGVNGHGPVHTASKAFLQQEFCNITILKRDTRAVRNITQQIKTDFYLSSPRGLDGWVLPGEGWCPVWPGWGSFPGWSERLAAGDGIRWRIWPLLQKVLVFLYHQLPSWIRDTTDTKETTMSKLSHLILTHYIHAGYIHFVSQLSSISSIQQGHFDFQWSPTPDKQTHNSPNKPTSLCKMRQKAFELGVISRCGRWTR